MYVPEAGVEGETTEKQHGGRRLDELGNTLGGRPKKPKFPGASKSQLGFFEFINRPKPPPKPTKEPAVSCVDREVNETDIFAAASETHTAESPSAGEAPHLVQPSDISNLLSGISTLLHEELSRALAAMRLGLEETKDRAISEVVEAGKAAAGKVSELQRMLKSHSQFSVLSCEHTAVLSTGCVFCATCTENIAVISDGRSLRSKFIASNGGVNQDSMLTTRWAEHCETELHKFCLEAAATRKLAPMDQAVSDFHVREQQVMQTLFKTCAFSNIHKQSFYMYEHNIVLLLSEGVDVGVNEHSRITAREMTVSLAVHGRQQFRSFLTSTNPMTGFKPHLGVAADKLTDLGKIQSQIIMGRVNYAGSPLTIFLKLEPLGLEYDEDHEASGLACFNQLCEVVYIFVDAHQILTIMTGIRGLRHVAV